MAAQKIAILGGGIGGLAAAYELSRQNQDEQDKYEITVYQMGWRIGGKMAAGRNMDSGKGHRIEEHGIHGFMGSYYNAGRMMTEVYAELKKRPGNEHYFTRFYDAFDKQHSAVRWEFHGGRWKPWLSDLPPNDRHYGNRDEDPRLTYGIEGLLGEALKELPNAGLDFAERLKLFIGQLLEQIQDNLQTFLKAGQRLVPLLSQTWNGLKPSGSWARLPDGVRRALVTIDFVCALLTGFFADKIPERGYESIDDQDYTDWLHKHGATTTTCRSPLALSTPAITYNFPGGDMSRGARMSAGAYLQWTLGVFGFAGAFVQAFTAGSGESILAPIYRLLSLRGVRFQFFHKVTNLHLSEDKSRIESVSLDVQATTKTGCPYEPLFGPVKGLMCWPDRPLYEQLEQGEELKKSGANLESFWTDWQPVARKELRAGVDFDKLVLNISLGAAPFIASELVADTSKPPPRGSDHASLWSAMVAEIETVQTQAMQLWFKKDIAKLTPNLSLPHDDTWIAGTYVLPIAGQADFTKLLPTEDWSEDGPRGLLYLCGPMADSGIPPADDIDFPRRQHERVRWQSIQYLEATAGPFLPKASTGRRTHPTTPASLDFEQLYCPDADIQGEARFDWHFWRANIDPSERYVTCQPGKARFRLRADGTGYTNLHPAGDWMFTGLNVGSVEGAVMGGMLTSNAISGSPPLSDISGYDPFKTL